MALAKIPDAWKKSVCTVLEEVLNGQDPAKVEWTIEAQADWDNQSISQGDAVAYDTLIEVLSDDQLMGREISLKRPPGTTWDFTFEYDTTYGRFTFYTKICLKRSGNGIRIVSLHMPEKGTLR